MDAAIEAVLREYEKRHEAELKMMREAPPAELAKRLDEFLLPVGPATGQLMNLLIKEAKAKTILEVGTSYGYSTVWLAEAARAPPEEEGLSRSLDRRLAPQTRSAT